MQFFPVDILTVRSVLVADVNADVNTEAPNVLEPVNLAATGWKPSCLSHTGILSPKESECCNFSCGVI